MFEARYSAIRRYLLSATSYAWFNGETTMTVRIADVTRAVRLYDTGSSLAVCNLIEDRLFQHVAGFRIIHRVGIQGGADTQYVLRSTRPPRRRFTDSNEQPMHLAAKLRRDWRRQPTAMKWVIILAVLGLILFAIGWNWVAIAGYG